MGFFDDAFTTPASGSQAPSDSSTTLTGEAVVMTPDSPVMIPPVDTSAAPVMADVAFEAPVFSAVGDANSIVQEEIPVILSQEIATDTPTIADSSVVSAVETSSPEAVAVFEPIVTAPLVEEEVTPMPIAETLIPATEMNIPSVVEAKAESSLDVRNPEDILDDTERLLRQSEQALEEQAKILESEAALHQEKSDEEKKAADSALQAAQSAHAKADKLEATIESIQKEKEKLSASV